MANVRRVEFSEFPFFEDCQKAEIFKDLDENKRVFDKPIRLINCKFKNLTFLAPAMMENSIVEKVKATSHLFFRECRIGDAETTGGHIVLVGELPVKSLTTTGNLHLYRDVIGFKATVGGKIFQVLSYQPDYIVYDNYRTPGLVLTAGVKTLVLEGNCHIKGSVTFCNDEIDPSEKQVILKPGAKLDGMVIGGNLVREE